MDKSVLKSKQLAELKEIAEALGLENYKSLKKADLIDLIASGGSANGDGADASSDDDGGDDEPATSADRVRARRRSRQDDRGGNDAKGSSKGSDDSDDDSDDDAGSGDEDGGGRSKDDNGGDRGGNGRQRSRNRSRNRGRGNQEDLDELEVREGVLDLLPEGYGFLRTTGYSSGEKDVYVSQAFVRRNQLRRGDVVAGPVRFNKGNDKFPALARIDAIEGEPYDEDAELEPRVNFGDLVPVHPDQRIRLADGKDVPAGMRILDLLAPIGMGQRGLIISPPKAGKTTMLRQLAQAIEANAPDAHLMVVMIDERPEEVTDFDRALESDVIASTFDSSAEDHTQVAELVLERAKRLVERGEDVVILLDSLTRLTRAYNVAAPSAGRTLPGGIDAGAIYPAKRYFGAARNIEDGGSLTIIATAMVDTGAKMDDVIFEEFSGTGNMEVRLDGDLERRRIFPAIGLERIGTRHDERLFSDDEYEAVAKLRSAIVDVDPEAASRLLIQKVQETDDNEQLLKMVGKSGL